MMGEYITVYSEKGVPVEYLAETAQLKRIPGKFFQDKTPQYMIRHINAQSRKPTYDGPYRKSPPSQKDPDQV